MSDPRIRVAFIDDSQEMGGAEHTLLHLMRRLTAHGRISPVLICRPCSKVATLAEDDSIVVRHLEIPRFVPISIARRQRRFFNPIAGAFDAYALFHSSQRLVGLLRGLSVHLIHTNTLFAHLYGGLAARRLRLPCVWHHQDMVERDRLWGLFSWALRTGAAHLADHVICVSRGVQSTLDNRVASTVIYNALDDAWWQPEGTIPQRTGNTVGFVGRIAYSKGLDILIDAMTTVTKAVADVRFDLVGNVPQAEASYSAHLKAKIREKQLSSVVRFLPYQNDLKALIRSWRLLVLPSRREAMGRVLIEAGALGIPVVATSVGGIPEVVQDGVTGLLVPPNNSQRLGEAIVKLLTHPDLALRMGQNARALTRQIFSSEVTIESVLNVYDKVLD